ncbi:hypothetical protein N0V94_004442 [Neodidymelliopsis sp. IMI 364377]|nr:hypothetical protein N0V94_004442 [Neodidymelliopsis sp. IMI 364377]
MGLPAVEKKKKEKKKVSTVRKTPITKQPSGKKPSASVEGAKRTSTRNKSSLPPSTTASVPSTIAILKEGVEEDAAHHAAATALLNLSFSSHDNHSPSTSFTSAVASSPSANTTTTTPTREKKRAYEPGAEAEADAGVEAKTTTSRPHKRAKTLHFQPLPAFAQEETARDGFLKGVEYAIAHFKAFKTHRDGDGDFEQLADLTELVKEELGLNAGDGRAQMPGTCYAGDAEDGAATLDSGRSLGGYAENGGRVKTRAFWDVV